MFLSSLLEAWDDPQWYPILFDSPMNIARGVCFWLTLALALGFLIAVLLLKGEKRAKFFKISLFAAIGYACAVALMFLIWNLIEDGIALLIFIPLVVLVAAVAACTVVLALRRDKFTYILSGCIVGAALVAVLVCMGVHYAQNYDSDGYYNSDIASVDQIVLYVSAAALLVLLVALALFFGRKDKSGFDSKSIAYAAVCIALSFALSYIRFVKLPQGGSVTLASLLPLMIYSYMFGVKKGLFAGLAYGLLQAVQDPYIIHPAQFMLDYPIAFAAIGIAGLFAQVKAFDKVPQVQFLLGAVAASALRFVSHVLSGVFAFSAYAADAGMNAWIYSLAYNSFVFADIAIAIAVGIFVFSSKNFVKQARKFHPKETKEQAA